MTRQACKQRTGRALGELGQLEETLGYRFGNRNLLTRALTHKSAGADNFERFEFLGDAVLGFVVARMLFEAHPAASQHELTLMRANLVNAAALAEAARRLELGRFLNLGEGERKSGGARRVSTLADALEAVLGAIVCDGGSDAAAQAVRRLFAERVAAPEAIAAKDAKTRLQELLQGQGQPLPEYRAEQGGAEHAPVFAATCRVGDLSRRGQGSSRREAEKAAAAAMLRALAETPSESASAPGVPGA